MSKPINIYHAKYKTILENYNNIDIIDIDNIINYSSGFIKFDHLQSFEYDTSAKILTILFNKLKLGGVLLISIKNIKLLSKLYSDDVLSDNQFLEHIKPQQSVWSIDLINDFINKQQQGCLITKIQNDNQNHDIYITVERQNI